MAQKWYSRAQAAEYLGCSPSSVDRYRLSGKLKAHSLDGGPYKYAGEDLDAMLIPAGQMELDLGERDVTRTEEAIHGSQCNDELPLPDGRTYECRGCATDEELARKAELERAEIRGGSPRTGTGRILQKLNQNKPPATKPSGTASKNPVIDLKQRCKGREIKNPVIDEVLQFSEAPPAPRKIPPLDTDFIKELGDAHFWATYKGDAPDD